MKPILTLLVVLPLVACANGSSLNPTTTADVDAALALACPVYASIAKKPPSMSVAEANAFNSLAAICPPNPAPTTTAAAVADIIQAYTILNGL